jgi:hypothetical protein
VLFGLRPIESSGAAMHQVGGSSDRLSGCLSVHSDKLDLVARPGILFPDGACGKF